MNKTSIESFLNPDGSQGYTCNSKTGCRHHTDGLCRGGGFPCYACRLANGRLRDRYIGNPDIALPKEMEGLDLHTEDVADQLHDPFWPRWWPERLEQIRKRKKPSGIFLNDMSDWMGDYWPTGWTELELEVIRGCPQHRFYTVTKQPQNLAKFSPFPDNCWVGATATNTGMFVDAMDKLYKIKAKIIYLSFEPLLEWHIEPDVLYGDLVAQQVNWLIIGACTGGKPELIELNKKYPELTLMPYGPAVFGMRWTLQPKLEWVQEIVESADRAGVAVFLKDNLRPLFKGRLFADESWAFDETIIENQVTGDQQANWKLRQEMPE